MTRMVAPDKGVRETEIGRKLYKPDRGGIYTVDNASHARAMKAEGFFEASLNPYDVKDSSRGFNCNACGFNGWFKKCGRCGHETDMTIGDGD